MLEPIVVVFPGQGSQFLGMSSGHETFFQQANKFLDYDLLEMAQNGPVEKLNLTENTQPAIVAHSYSAWVKAQSTFQDLGIEVNFVLGHSVGEYSALVANGVLGFEDAIRAVHWRGKYMQEAVPVGVGGMTAILRAEQDIVIQACREVSTPNSIVEPANFNEPGQVVISGHLEACKKAEEWIIQHSSGRVRALPLTVSAPFHSSLMRPAANKLEATLSSIKFNKIRIPYVANIDATTYGPENSTEELIKNNLVKQLAGSVQWTQSIKSLPPHCRFIEMGPGKVLQGLIKKILPEAKITSFDGQDSSLLKDFLIS